MITGFSIWWYVSKKKIISSLKLTTEVHALSLKKICDYSFFFVATNSTLPLLRELVNNASSNKSAQRLHPYTEVHALLWHKYFCDYSFCRHKTHNFIIRTGMCYIGTFKKHTRIFNNVSTKTTTILTGLMERGEQEGLQVSKMTTTILT